LGTRVVYTWPAPDADGICLDQTTAGAANLILNGALATSVGGFSPRVILTNIVRTVSLTSGANLSGINFTVTGKLFGTTVTETLAGPNVNTVETTAKFEEITSISSNAAVASNVSVGTGTTGYIYPFKGNYHATVIGTSVQVNVTNTIDYSFSVTLNEDINTALFFTPVAAMTGATTDQLAFYNAPFNYGRITINSSTNGSLEAIFLQQGIT